MIRNKFLLFCFVIATTFSLNAQNVTNDKAWGLLLTDFDFRYIYSQKYDAVLPKPKFGKKLRKLNGQTITIQGFFLPLDLTGGVFILSYNPMISCFFCGVGGPQTIIELNVLPKHIKKFERLRTDNFFEVRGELRLNKNITEHLMYILDEVEFVRLIS